MATQITAVRYSSTQKALEHIVRVQTADGSEYDVATMVQVVTAAPESVYVTGGGRMAFVQAVRPTSGRPYIRTRADGYGADNLLSLPEF